MGREAALPDRGQLLQVLAWGRRAQKARLQNNPDPKKVGFVGFRANQKFLVSLFSKSEWV